MADETVSADSKTERPWLFKSGAEWRGNANGRPKGSTSLKTFTRDFLLSLSEEDKKLFLGDMVARGQFIDVWKMAEGNPHSTSDETVKHIIPTPIMKLDKVDVPPVNVIEEPPMKDASP